MVSSNLFQYRRSMEGDPASPTSGRRPFLQGAKYSLHIHLPRKLATNLSKSSAISPFLSKAVLCRLSFCFALRLSELSVRVHLSKPVWIGCALCSSACIQMTSPSFLAYTHFLIILKFCFTPAPFFFLAEVLSWCCLVQKQLRVSSPGMQ